MGLSYSEGLISNINCCSEKISESNDYVNEFFLYFIVPELERSYGMYGDRGGNASAVSSFIGAGRGLKMLLEFSVLFVCEILYCIALPLYILFRYRPEKYASTARAISISRSVATYSKMAFLRREGVNFYSDTLVFQQPRSGLSIYAQPLITRLWGGLVIPWLGVRDWFALFGMAKKHLGIAAALNVVKYYRKRVAHKVTFEFYFRCLMDDVAPSTLYTGNKEDRFALIEKRICKEMGVRTVCIPHGLEYSFKMPAGLVGDVFYCNSECSRKYLTNLYDKSSASFVFDENMVANMLSRRREFSNINKVVFFPESREPEINLLVMRMLVDLKLSFFVKLHSKDSLVNYSDIIEERHLIRDFDDAITNSICLARKSTVLLEAIYNNSIPVAVLVDSKDRDYFDFMFPSLRDEKINKVYSFLDLKDVLYRLGAKSVSE